MSANNSGLVLNCTAIYAIAAPAATVLSVTMQTSPTVAGVTELQVPLTENWIATDVYILAAIGAGTGAKLNGATCTSFGMSINTGPGRPDIAR